MISIIIRAKNEMPWLKYCLAMLKRQSLQNFELICVDSGSTDGSWELLIANNPQVLYQIAPQDYIPGKVLNQAIRQARGDIIVFNNADCIPLDCKWLENLVRPFAAHPELVAVFANQIARPNAIPLVEKDYQRAFGDGSISSKWRHFFSLASSAVRRETILAHPFNETIQYSEDIEWSWRMKQLGHSIMYVPDARVQHSHNYNLKQIKKRFLGEGKAEAEIYGDYYREHPQDLSFMRSVIFAAASETLRDWKYLCKTGNLDWLIRAKIYRLAQRYFAYLGRKEGLRQRSPYPENSILASSGFKSPACANILVSCLAFDEGKSGISDYIISVCSKMLENNKLTLLIHPSDAKIFPLRHANLGFIEIPEWIKRPAVSMFWHLFIIPFYYSFSTYDLVFLPAGNRRLMARYPAHTVVTFHDLSQFHIAAKYDALRMFYIKHIIPYFLRKAPVIYAISESTKADLVKYYHIPAARIGVNYNGYDPQKLKTAISKEELFKRLSLSKKYLLYIARIEHPGKNHLNLLKAYQMLPEELKAEYDLICPGGHWNGSETVLNYARQMPCSANIHFPGFVSNEEVAALYANASLYVFPSLYEGFGIPMLEAFAAELPVVCSNCSSLPEIGGDAVLCFDPQVPSDIARQITSVLADAQLGQDLVSKGRIRLEQFSWQTHTDKILSSFVKD